MSLTRDPSLLSSLLTAAVSISWARPPPASSLSRSTSPTLTKLRAESPVRPANPKMAFMGCVVSNVDFTGPTIILKIASPDSDIQELRAYGEGQVVQSDECMLKRQIRLARVRRILSAR